MSAFIALPTITPLSLTKGRNPQTSSKSTSIVGAGFSAAGSASGSLSMASEGIRRRFLSFAAAGMAFTCTGFGAETVSQFQSGNITFETSWTSISRTPLGTIISNLSPIFFPIRALAIGETNDTRPFEVSASSTPTIRIILSLYFTKEPKAIIPAAAFEGSTRTAVLIRSSRSLSLASMKLRAI